METTFQFFNMTDYLTESFSKDEIRNQGKALMQLMGKNRNKDLELALINKFGAEFRGIINDFKKLYKPTPSPEQLIWIAGVHAKKDPRLITQEIAQKMGIN